MAPIEVHWTTRHRHRRLPRSRPTHLRSLPQASTFGRAGSDCISFGLINARSIANKSFFLNDFFASKDLDYMLISETWQKADDFVSLNELCPQNCAYSCSPRTSGRGGGLAVVHRDCFSSRTLNAGTYSSFEILVNKIGRTNPFHCVLVYRPPGRNSSFLNEFGDFLASIISLERVLLVGDFNAHINKSGMDTFATDFLNLTESFNFTQHVSGPTHNKGNTLDLVFSIGLKVTNVSTEELLVSDHKCVLFSVFSDIDFVPERRVIHSRVVNSTAVNNFITRFINDDNVLVSTGNDVNYLVNSFNMRCASILDDVAPLVTRSVRPVNPSPWLDSTITDLRRKCRKIERKWKSSQLEVHRLHLKDLRAEYNVSVGHARAAYFSNIISSSGHNPRILFQTINTLVSPPPPATPVMSNDDCNSFLRFFVSRVANILLNIAPSLSLPPPLHHTTQASLSNFSLISMADLTGIVSSMKSSSSPLDVLPTFMLKDAISSVGPSLVSIINTSLVSGSVPAYFKEAVVQPLLKKPNLDPSVHNNYRPISKLPFISKLLEKVVANQLTSHMTKHNICDKFQSGFRKHHSTESALLRVSNDIMMSSDSGECSVLVLLDLSAAFDTISHTILLERLREWVGISGSVLDWFASYLSERRFSVTVGPFKSDTAPLTSGVPQGSVLGPLLFAIYMLPLGPIINNFTGIKYHFYADDIQLHCSLKSDNPGILNTLQECLLSIDSWLGNNFLQLNSNKTEVLIVAADQTASKVASFMGSLQANIRPHIRNLGVIFDQSMHLDNHVKSLTRTCFYHLRNIAKLRSIISHSELELSIHAFISSRLDYCNSLFTCLNKTSINKLQLVQNAAARLLTRSKKSCHITPILVSLHWLPIQYRIHFKVLTLTFKALHNQAPAYITELIKPYCNTRPLRSADHHLLVVPRTKLKTRGDRAFEVMAPRLWNTLPLYLRTTSTEDTFKKLLKTHLFRQAFGHP